MTDKKHWYDGIFYDKIIAPNQDRMFTQIKNIIKPNSNVLDIGCGTGRLSFQLSDHCKNVVGVDLSSKNIKVANTKKNNQYSYEPITTKIISLHKGNSLVNEILPGASISIETELDPFMTKTDSLTGSVVSTIGKLPEITSKVKIKIELFKEVLGEEQKEKVTNLKTKEMLMLSVNTTITVGTVEKISDDLIEMNLNIPIVALKGDNVGVARNINGHWRLIGFGEIVD